MQHHIPIPAGGGRSVNHHDTAIQDLPECGWAAVETSARAYARRELYCDTVTMAAMVVMGIGVVVTAVGAFYLVASLVPGLFEAGSMRVHVAAYWAGPVLLAVSALLAVAARAMMRRRNRPRVIELPWEAGIEKTLTKKKRDALFASANPEALLEHFAVDAVLAEAESIVSAGDEGARR